MVSARKLTGMLGSRDRDGKSLVAPFHWPPALSGQLPAITSRTGCAPIKAQSHTSDAERLFMASNIVLTV